MVIYLKYIIYNFLNLFDSFVNFICSLFCFYPKCDISTNFLVSIELRRVEGEIDTRSTEKASRLGDADEMVDAAKYYDVWDTDDFYGKDESHTLEE